jgi:hypothetical protein
MASAGCRDRITSLTTELDVARFGEMYRPVTRFLDARRSGHSGEQFWRKPGPGSADASPIPKGTPTVINPSRWEIVLGEKRLGDMVSSYRLRVQATTAEGVAIERLWDFCVHKVEHAPMLAAIFDASDEARGAACATSLDWERFASRPEVKELAPGPSPGAHSSEQEKVLQEAEAFLDRVEREDEQRPRQKPGMHCAAPRDCEDGDFCVDQRCLRPRRRGSDCKRDVECEDILTCQRNKCAPPTAP